jgi:hypothetical protein
MDTLTAAPRPAIGRGRRLVRTALIAAAIAWTAAVGITAHRTGIDFTNWKFVLVSTGYFTTASALIGTFAPGRTR